MIRALFTESAIIRAMIAVVALGAAAARRSAVALRALLRTAPESTARSAEPAPLDAIVSGGRIVRAWRQGEDVVRRGWLGSSTRRRIAQLADEANLLSAADVAQLAGVGLASALVANLALAGVEILAAGSTVLLVRVVIAIVAAALIAKPRAIGAAWVNRRR
jgi:hypothetical protein